MTCTRCMAGQDHRSRLRKARAVSNTRVVLRIVLIVVTVVLTLYLIYLLRQPLTWLVIAAFLALALSAPVAFFDRYMPRGLAIAVVYLLLILVPIGIGAA